MSEVGLTLLTTLIEVGASLYSGYKQNEALEDSKAESERWARLQRQDTLNAQAANEKINKWNMRLREKEFKWQKSEAEKNRKERAEERIYSRRENQWSKILGIANQNNQIKDSLLAYFPKVQPA